MSNVLDIPFDDMDGNSQTLRKLGGSSTDTWLVVNVASACGMTKQYADLQQASTEHALLVVGFPCNQFGGQEPGSHEEICRFTSETYGVDFPLMSKINVKGENQSPLYEALTKITGVDGHQGSVRWNFEKFLINKEGVATRFPSQTPIKTII
jgi:glutathione peroxidase